MYRTSTAKLFESLVWLERRYRNAFTIQDGRAKDWALLDSTSDLEEKVNSDFKYLFEKMKTI